MAIYDAIVIGVGGMGSAALYQMARQGMKVIGLDRYDIPNDMGSSHGISRIIRLTYHEDPSYVPLLRRSYELWRQLENTANERLLISTGIINAGKESSSVFQGSKESCEIHNVPYEVMSGPEVNQRFPRLPASRGLGGGLPGRRRIPVVRALHRSQRQRCPGVGRRGPRAGTGHLLEADPRRRPGGDPPLRLRRPETGNRRRRMVRRDGVHPATHRHS